MTIEERKTDTRAFLEDLDKHGLINRINSKLLNDEYTRNFPKFIESSARTFNELIQQYEDGKTNLAVSNADMTMFVCGFGLSITNSFLEFIKKMLRILVDKNQINSEGFLTYGQLIYMLCDKLGLDESQRKPIKRNFYIDLRNALSHIDYYITEEGIFIKIDNKTLHLDMDGFNEMVYEIRAVADTLTEFVNEKVSQTEKKAEELEDQVKELKQKAELIRKTNTNRHKEMLAIKYKTARIKSDTKRKKRKTEKINKMTKRIQRLNRKIQRNNVRIVSHTM